MLFYRPNSVTINITQEDIDFGIQGSPINCMVARAAKRSYFKDNEISVGSGAIIDTTMNRYYPLPDDVQLRISMWDRSKMMMKPFSFELELV